MSKLAIIKATPAGSIFTEEFIGKGGQQTYKFTSMGTLGAHRFRIDITKDDYARQSHAWIQVWSVAEMKWNEVARLDGESSVMAGMQSPYSADVAAQRASCRFVAQILIESALYVVA